MSYDKKEKLHIVAITAVIHNSQNKFLILKRPDREIVAPGKYSLPGGKVEGNDSIDQTLFKEVLEETGLQIRPEKLLLKEISFVRPDQQTVKVFSYLCQPVDEKQLNLSEDFADMRWVSPEEVNALPRIGIDEELRLAEKILSSDLDWKRFATRSAKYNQENL